MADTTSGSKIKLVLLTPVKKMFEVETSELCLPACGGELGVLPGHESYVAQLGYGVLTYVLDGKTFYYAVEAGMAEISNNVVTVLADSAEEAASIDLERAQKALARAQERRKGISAEVDMIRAEKAEHRAMARIDAAMLYSLLKKK
jgi:F-type H+-transporting ATPase subunit epsilon